MSYKTYSFHTANGIVSISAEEMVKCGWQLIKFVEEAMEDLGVPEPEEVMPIRDYSGLQKFLDEQNRLTLFNGLPVTFEFTDEQIESIMHLPDTASQIRYLSVAEQFRSIECPSLLSPMPGLEAWIPKESISAPCIFDGKNLEEVTVTDKGNLVWHGSQAVFRDIDSVKFSEILEAVYGDDLAEQLNAIPNKTCNHEWVNTGFRKSWCKHCDVDMPETEC